MLAASAGALGQTLSAAKPDKPQYFQIQTLYLRNGTQTARTEEFLSKSYAPALRKLGLPPFGIFQPVIGEQSPLYLVLLTFPSIEAAEGLPDRMAADADYQKAVAEYTSGEPSYVRRDSSLLRAFAGMPKLRPPAAKEGGDRIFEIRTYESNTSSTLKRKIQMFEQGEIAIFERLGMQPVFFAETIFGRNLPSLTYMLAYEDLAARDRVWKAFGADGEWRKLRAALGNSDAEIVSNISNSIVRPAPFSQLK